MLLDILGLLVIIIGLIDCNMSIKILLMRDKSFTDYLFVLFAGLFGCFLLYIGLGLIICDFKG